MIQQSRTISSRIRLAVLLGAMAPIAITACSGASEATKATSAMPSHSTSAMMEEASKTIATASLKGVGDEEMGSATFTQIDEKNIQISVDAKGLTPGFHGIHVHSVGKCEVDSAAPGKPEKTGNFLSAGGHLHLDHEGDHAGHNHQANGDLPSLLVGEDGTAHLTVNTDRLTQAGLFDGEGTSLIVHAGADNHANIPQRYAPEGPDAETRATGDAGARVACGVITKK